MVRIGPSAQAVFAAIQVSIEAIATSQGRPWPPCFASNGMPGQPPSTKAW